MNDIFAGFEEVQDLPEGVVVLAYGVNVIRIDAEVTTPRTETVDELVAQYREKLDLPANAVVFIDGQKVNGSAVIPANAARIEIVKPAGEKGSDAPIIPLEDEASCTIEVYVRIAMKVIRRTIEEIGRMSAALLEVVELPETAIVDRDGEDAIISLARTETVAERTALRQTASIRRRLPQTINEIWAAWPGHAETFLNDEEVDGCTELGAGDRLTLIVTGGEEEVSFDDWAAEMHAQAASAYHTAAMAADQLAFERRRALEAISFLALRSAAKAARVVAWGLGRTKDVLVEEILAAEFATANRQAWIEGWLSSHAPEAIGWEAPEEGDWDEEDEESIPAPSSDSRW